MDGDPVKVAMDLLEAVPLQGMRAVIARNLTQSLRDMAQLTLHRQIDPGELLALRERLREPVRPSLNSLVLAAVAHVLPRHPAVNATLEEDTIYRWAGVNLGMAVAVDAGLLVPVIRDAHALSLAEIQEQSTELARQARAGRLALTDMEGATFTVTNLGGFRIDSFTPIVNPPQVAILGVGRAVRDSMTLSLTIDHRALDGAPAARFLDDLAEALEQPSAMLRYD